MRQLNDLRREVVKLKEKAADSIIRYRMKDSTIVTLTGKESEAFVAWVFNNADKNYRASNGSKLHVLTQMVQGTLNTPFESFASFKQRGGDLFVVDEV